MVVRGKPLKYLQESIPGRRNSKGKESGAKRVFSVMGTARSLCARAGRHAGRVRGYEVRKARGRAEVQAVQASAGHGFKDSGFNS